MMLLDEPLPGRSFLVSVAPVGVDTPHVESLKSFVQRLAFVNSLKPVSMLELVFAEYKVPVSRATLAEWVKDWSIHGVGQSLDVMRWVLSRATVQPLQAIERLGMSELGRHFSSEQVIQSPAGGSRQGGVYCPLCVQEHHAYGDVSIPYGQLLWEVCAVSACPLHGVRLRSAHHCGAAPQRKLHRASAPSLAGVCSQCGAKGFSCVEDPPELASEDEIWRARQIGAVLAMDAAARAQVSTQAIRNVVNELVTTGYGSAASAALKLGCAKSSLSGWVNRKNMPSFKNLVRLASGCGADIVQALQGKCVIVRQDGSKSEAWGMRPYARSHLAHDDIEAKLSAIADGDGSVSLAAACAEVALERKSAHKRFPELARRIVAKHEAFRLARDQEAFNSARAAYIAAAQRLQSSGRTVHSRVIQSEAGLVAYSRNPCRVRALEEAMAWLNMQPPPTEVVIH